MGDHLGTADLIGSFPFYLFFIFIIFIYLFIIFLPPLPSALSPYFTTMAQFDSLNLKIFNSS